MAEPSATGDSLADKGEGVKQSDRESARATFYTAIDATPEPKSSKKDARQVQRFKTLESTRSGPDIVERHSDLENLALTLDQRMGALLREHEKDFFLAYKTHMYNVQKEIRSLKLKADQEEAKTREDTKIKALEGELDWFMTEALRLDELCKGYKKEVDKWKAKAEALDEDRRFLEDQIKGAKRQNKILRAAAERARSSAYSALMVTKQKSEERSGTPGNNGRTPALADVPARSSSATGDHPRSHDPMGGYPQGRSRTPDARVALAPISGTASSSALVPIGGGHRGGASMALDAMSSPSSVAHTLSRGVLGNDAEERYVEAIQHLKESIVHEQSTIRMLQAARSTAYCKKSELEELFLKCVDEARRDSVKRRHLSLHRQKSEREQVLDAMLNNEDVLVCLYEKLFPHRTGIARSLGGVHDTDEVRKLSSLPLDSLGDHEHGSGCGH